MQWVTTTKRTLQRFRGGSKFKVYIGILASALISRIEREFDFLGYHFGPEGLAIAQKTLENFVERAIRLYEQGNDIGRLWQYITRWTRWLQVALDGLVSRKGGAKRYLVHVLIKLRISGINLRQA